MHTQLLDIHSTCTCISSICSGLSHSHCYFNIITSPGRKKCGRASRMTSDYWEREILVPINLNFSLPAILYGFLFNV